MSMGCTRSQILLTFPMRSKDPVIEGVMTFQVISDSHLAVFPIFLVSELQQMKVYLKLNSDMEMYLSTEAGHRWVGICYHKGS